MRSFGIPNVWVGVVSLVAWIVLIDDSPKGQDKLIPIGGFHGGPGLKLALICPSQPVPAGCVRRFWNGGVSAPLNWQ